MFYCSLDVGLCPLLYVTYNSFYQNLGQINVFSTFNLGMIICHVYPTLRMGIVLAIGAGSQKTESKRTELLHHPDISW